MIGVVGLGYVGITSLLCFHALGKKMVGVDKNIDTVNKLKEGKLHIEDKKLSNYLLQNYKDMNFNNDLNSLLNFEDVFICVPTDGFDGGLDLSIVDLVLSELDNLNIKNIWIRSTIDDPQIFASLKTNNSNIFSFPEFLREGKCWDDFFDPPLMVLGGEGVKKTKIYDVLSEKISSPEVCSTKEAITVKIACNAFHALKVTFTNELRNLKWNKEININRVMEIFSTDTKLNISSAYLKPGLPFGGPCLPKDTKALAKAILDNNNKSNLFDKVIERNDKVKTIYANAISKLSFKKIGFYGLEFKPGTGDLRNSPIIDIAKILAKENMVFVYDMYLRNLQLYPEFHICNKFDELIDKCEIIITYQNISDPKFINWNDIVI